MDRFSQQVFFHGRTSISKKDRAAVT